MDGGSLTSRARREFPWWAFRCRRRFFVLEFGPALRVLLLLLLLCCVLFCFCLFLFCFVFGLFVFVVVIFFWGGGGGGDGSRVEIPSATISPTR